MGAGRTTLRVFRGLLRFGRGRTVELAPTAVRPLGPDQLGDCLLQVLGVGVGELQSPQAKDAVLGLTRPGLEQPLQGLGALTDQGRGRPSLRFRVPVLRCQFAPWTKRMQTPQRHGRRGEVARLRRRPLRLGQPVAAPARGHGQIMCHSGRCLVRLPAGGFQGPQGISGPDDTARLTFPFLVIVEGRAQVGLGVLGDGLERIGRDRKPAPTGQVQRHRRHCLVMTRETVAAPRIFLGTGLDQERQCPHHRGADRFPARNRIRRRAPLSIPCCNGDAPTRGQPQDQDEGCAYKS